VPAGAPYLDGKPNDPTSTYIVVMGSGTLTLVDSWPIKGSFRIKVETDGMGIPIDASVGMGPLGVATAYGRVELSMAGLVAGILLSRFARLNYGKLVSISI
jgi:hypothetical protein